MNFELFSAKTVNDCITEACQQFSVTSDKLEYEVIEEGSNGFLGIGSKQAVIRARVKREEKAEPVKEVKAEKKEEAVSSESKSKVRPSTLPAEEIETKAKEFLHSVFVAMNMAVVIETSYDAQESTLNVDLSGEDMGVLIGKRGQTLDSLQYLVSLVVNTRKDEYIRVKVDTENYRQRRKETLENLAKNIAYKVKRTKRAVSLEAMNPYERRIIHSALQNDKYVTTHSEGEEPYRHVVVTLKR
ncbi:MAG: protein jag [Lachnospiraceae bacterium]|nr:protein jag [Lachnospiraceae bacterium]